MKRFRVSSPCVCVFEVSGMVVLVRVWSIESLLDRLG
jgi:hypothetical protein